MQLLLLVLPGCQKKDLTGASAEATPPITNLANYKVVRDWKHGLEIEVDRYGTSALTQEDLETIQREISGRYPMEGRSVVIFKDDRGEVGRYLVDGDKWNFHGEQ